MHEPDGPEHHVAGQRRVRPASRRGRHPAYTDIQRIFNKGCIECHGGLYYPPVRNHRFITQDFTEDENPPAGDRRLWRSLKVARSLIGGPTCPPNVATCTDAAATNVANSQLYSRITDFGNLVHPYDP